jgi:putative membrane protein
MKLSDMSDAVVSSAVFAGIGLAVFGVAFWIMTKVAPFSMKKEIEEDQNVSLGIIVAGVLIGIALIISAAIHG